ncbi:MAG: S1C family serine protease [Nanoarchaeota archaeon]
MPLKRHHKIILGGFSSIVFIFMIIVGILIYLLFVKQDFQYNQLSQQIENLQTDTQTKMNELSENIINTKESLSSLGSQIGSIDKEINLLKASAGEDFSGIIEEAIKAVVTIKTDTSQGTGFIIEETGYLITNYHVMEGAKSAGIFTFNDKVHQVKLIGYDEDFDLALLKIEGNYEKLELADSDDAQIGEKVIAIGNPLGLQFSVSQGIISNLHQEGPTGQEAYIQTDAALNPGNSGGPLINKQGKVVGINNFKIKETEGLGFALESNYIKDIVNEIDCKKTRKF